MTVKASKNKQPEKETKRDGLKAKREFKPCNTRYGSAETGAFLVLWAASLTKLPNWQALG